VLASSRRRSAAVSGSSAMCSAPAASSVRIGADRSHHQPARVRRGLVMRRIRRIAARSLIPGVRPLDSRRRVPAAPGLRESRPQRGGGGRRQRRITVRPRIPWRVASRSRWRRRPGSNPAPLQALRAVSHDQARRGRPRAFDRQGRDRGARGAHRRSEPRRRRRVFRVWLPGAGEAAEEIGGTRARRVDCRLSQRLVPQTRGSPLAKGARGI